MPITVTLRACASPRAPFGSETHGSGNARDSDTEPSTPAATSSGSGSTPTSGSATLSATLTAPALLCSGNEGERALAAKAVGWLACVEPGALLPVMGALGEEGFELDPLGSLFAARFRAPT